MTSRTGGARVTIQEQVDDLLAKMTPAEKAGQLTQYFYFRLPEDAPGPVLDFDPDEQPRMVESTLQQGGLPIGSALARGDQLIASGHISRNMYH